ncbi:MAG: hypothetical protein KDC61_16105, partial [Saprospiraceae bacterium]|nr:hypothetical protein [Saprospiraceae bacterium]
VDFTNPDPLQVSTTVTDAATGTSLDGKVSIQDIGGGTPPYYIQWSTGDSAIFQIDGLLYGFYQLSVTDSNGCDTVISVEVKITSATDEIFPSDWDARISTGFSSSQNKIITLTLTGTESHDFKYILFDSSGRRLGNGAFQSGAGVKDIEIP